ncbi:MAG: hypothetical protein ACFFD4_00435 [Candidatus Odinarchaeota archaeon]
MKFQHLTTGAVKGSHYTFQPVLTGWRAIYPLIITTTGYKPAET